MVLNTTTGAVEYDRSRPGHVVNTSAILEEPGMVFEDAEPEIIAVVPGTGWAALIEGESVPLVVWVVLDSGEAYGVILGEDGLLDPQVSVETLHGFSGYKQANNR
jgi:hypothetical protein